MSDKGDDDIAVDWELEYISNSLIQTLYSPFVSCRKKIKKEIIKISVMQNRRD